VQTEDEIAEQAARALNKRKREEKNVIKGQRPLDNVDYVEATT
jgi:hypothetical protein